MDTSPPGEPHKKLQALIGSWIGDEQIKPSPWDREGGPAEGRLENHSILNGFAVAHDDTQRRNGQAAFEGHGVFRYDASSEEYQLHWFDSLGQAPGAFRGRFDGDLLRLESSYGGGQTRVQPGTSRTPTTYATRWRSLATEGAGRYSLRVCTGGHSLDTLPLNWERRFRR